VWQYLTKGIYLLKSTSSKQLVQPSACLSLMVDTTRHHIAVVPKQNEEGRVTSNIYVRVNLLPYETPDKGGPLLPHHT